MDDDILGIIFGLVLSAFVVTYALAFVIIVGGVIAALAVLGLLLILPGFLHGFFGHPNRRDL